MKFVFYWIDGRLDILEGSTVNVAFSTKYGAGAFPALDFYEQADEPSYTWDAKHHCWTPNVPPISIKE